MANPALRTAAGAAGQRTIAVNQGSVTRTLELLANHVHAGIARQDRDHVRGSTAVANPGSKH